MSIINISSIMEYKIEFQEFDCVNQNGEASTDRHREFMYLFAVQGFLCPFHQGGIIPIKQYDVECDISSNEQDSSFKGKYSDKQCCK